MTCLTRDHGKISGLAKGAHRPDSPLLGRIDFLNELDATFSADRGGLRILISARLTRERRALRTPQRFLAAGHIAWLVDAASDEGRADAELFDLLQGALNLLERCPEPSIQQVVLGLELRFLQVLGSLPDLEFCTDCGQPLEPGAFRPADTMGLACHQHAGLPRRSIPTASLRLLQKLGATPGREWPTMAIGAELRAAATLPALWLAGALEQRAPHRQMVFAGNLLAGNRSASRPDRKPAD